MVALQIGHLQDPVTWYGINYTGTQMTQWDSQNKGTRTSPARLSFVLKVPLRHLRPSVIYSVPCDWILQMAYLQWESKFISIFWVLYKNSFNILNLFEVGREKDLNTN